MNSITENHKTDKTIKYDLILFLDMLQLSGAPSREESLDIDDVAKATEILDGCRPRKPSPLTIIQVKNPECSLEADFHWLSAFAIRKICIFAICGIGIFLSFVAALSWTLTYCDDGLDENGNSCRNGAFILWEGKTRPQGSVWTKVFDDIGKCTKESIDVTKDFSMSSNFPLVAHLAKITFYDDVILCHNMLYA